MSPGMASDPRRSPSRKDGAVFAWAARYEELALIGVRSRDVTERIGLHLCLGPHGHGERDNRGRQSRTCSATTTSCTPRASGR